MEALLEAWELSAPELLAETVMGRIHRVTRGDGSFAVLKVLSAVGQKCEGNAADVLRALGPDAAVEIYEADSEAVLMEHCAGPSLMESPDDATALPVFADLVRRSRSAPLAGIETLEERCQALARGSDLAQDERESGLFARGAEVARKLLASAAAPVLLHGDLHHDNVLKAARGWLMIDPQGLIGERCYEVANIFGNPLRHPELVLDAGRPRRLAQYFARELGFDEERVLAWAFSHNCISAAWLREDGEDPAFRLDVAEMIEKAM